eukprot:g10814.t1
MGAALPSQQLHCCTAMTPEQLKEEKSNELDDPVLKSPTRGNKIGFNLSADSFQFPDFPVPSFLSSDGQLGVDVHETSDGRMLRIESVHETGLVHEWNVLSLQRERKTGGSTGSYSSSSSGGGRSSSSFYSHAVQAGDYITGANGVRNDAKGMLAECSSRGAAEKTLRLEILRVLN